MSDRHYYVLCHQPAGDYHTQANGQRVEYEARVLIALSLGTDSKQVVKEMAHKLTNRLMHVPTKSLQQAAREGAAERLHIFRDGLGLDTH